MMSSAPAPQQPNTQQSRPDLRRADGGAIRMLVVDDEKTLSDLLAMACSRT